MDNQQDNEAKGKAKDEAEMEEGRELVFKIFVALIMGAGIVCGLMTILTWIVPYGFWGNEIVRVVLLCSAPILTFIANLIINIILHKKERGKK